MTATLGVASSHSVRLAAPASIRAEIQVPGDKSISHRAAIMNALAHGEARIVSY